MTALAYAAQAFVLLATLLMWPLGWRSPLYVPALMQAGLAFALLSWLAARRRPVVVLVPVLSAALTVALVLVDAGARRATACTDAERAAALHVAAPPSTSVQLEGTYTGGCIARTRMRLSNQAILEHYRAGFTGFGWQETPDPNALTVRTGAVKDGIRIDVAINTGDEGGSAAARREKDVVIRVSDAGR